METSKRKLDNLTAYKLQQKMQQWKLKKEALDPLTAFANELHNYVIVKEHGYVLLSEQAGSHPAYVMRLMDDPRDILLVCTGANVNEQIPPSLDWTINVIVGGTEMATFNENEGYGKIEDYILDQVAEWQAEKEFKIRRK